MKNYPIELSLVSILLFMPMLILWAYGDKLMIRTPASAPISAINLVLDISSAVNNKPSVTPSQTPKPTRTLTPTSRPTATFTPSATATATEIPPTATETVTPVDTPTFGQMLKDHIVFYLIQPEKGRQDACGDIQLVPIVSRRLRSGDKLYDVQVALQMLFSMKRKIYIQWYNALWDTDLSIASYEYFPLPKDDMVIHFQGYLPAGQLSNCDKHGIREQIWTTFFHYGIKEKTFMINGVFLIDQLNRKTP